MRYTLGQAAKATGKSKTTMMRAVKSGKISGNRLEDGRYAIDPAELHRVYPMVESATGALPPQSNDTHPQASPPDIQAEVTILRALLDREKEAVTELKEERDAWKKQATSLLTDQRSKGFWASIFKR